MSNFFDGIRDIYAKHGRLFELPPGCSLNKIREFENMLAWEFPSSFSELYLMANGSGKCAIGAFQFRNTPIPFGFISLERCVKEKKLFPWAYEHLNPKSSQFEKEPKVNAYRMRSWIPIARDKIGLGGALFFDPCPGPLGTEGQIVFCDVTELFVLCSSFNDLCDTFADGLERYWKMMDSEDATFGLY
ncbi:MAG: SMI1/KNR4 family protein [Planctomycetes bacterium]|nr:SMI1/KNR4 family protein [Planctomycetota bacterium]